MDLILQGRNIVKSFGDVKVLKGIDLGIKKGEIVSIVGDSGAGKSTLLQILGTLDSADSGEVILNNKNAQMLGSNALARFRNQHIGFIFQFHNLLPEFTALENVSLPGYIANANGKDVEEKALQLLTRLGVDQRKDNKPSQLSGGELQRAAVARALINNPDIVFADEPSGNLDSKNATELHKLFFRLRDEMGQAFVIVTHNNNLAKMADRILEIKDGKILH